MQFTASTLRTSVIEILKHYPLPYLNQDAISGGWFHDVHLDNYLLSIQLKFGFPLSQGIHTLIQERLQPPLSQLPDVSAVKITVQCQVRAHVVQPGLAALPKVKNVIAVASGKGGVGKSTTAVNLALALARQGARIGILDADIYGPNLPHILGAQGKPEILDDNTFIPLTAHGLQTMSIGYLIDEATPVIWRGPKISGALQQLVRDTRWDNLDYLIVDLPPGTGDIQLTLAEKIPVTGVVMVTTPQDLALLDVRKGLEMFRKVNVTVLGVIENMSTHICSHCGHAEALFGEDGGKRFAQRYEIPLFGCIPLALAIREDVDRGCPTVAADPLGPLALQYQQMALRIAADVSQLKINHGARLPPVVVENLR